MDGDGDYLLVLKMSEVYFNAPNMKVFDVVLNGDLTVSSDLDIFEKVRWSKIAENTIITPICQIILPKPNTLVFTRFSLHFLFRLVGELPTTSTLSFP